MKFVYVLALSGIMMLLTGCEALVTSPTCVASAPASESCDVPSCENGLLPKTDCEDEEDDDYPLIGSWLLVSSGQANPLAEISLYRIDAVTPEIRVKALSFLEAGTIFVQLPHHCFHFNQTNPVGPVTVPEYRMNRVREGEMRFFVSTGWVQVGDSCTDTRAMGHLTWNVTGSVFGGKGILPFEWLPLSQDSTDP